MTVATPAGQAAAQKSITPTYGISGFTGRLDPTRPLEEVAPNPHEDGVGGRAGSFDVRNVLLVPRDPRGIVLVCGFVGLAALGAEVVAVAGDWIGFGFLAAAVGGYLFVRTRLVPATVGALVAAYGALGASAGNSSDWLVIALGGLLVIAALFPPVDWTEQPTSRFLEVNDAPNSNGSPHVPATGEDELPAAPVAEKRERLSLRTIGTLQLVVDGRDRLQRVRQQSRLEFLLAYLIAYRVASSGAPSDRQAIAAEFAPNIDASNQLDRLRKALNRLRAGLGPDLKHLIHSTSSHLRLDLTGIEVDFIALSETAAEIGRQPGLVDASTAEDIRTLLEATATGEFLAGFSELEHEVTEGRGAAASVVDDARMKVNGWRADLAAALARHYEAAGHPQSSIAYLRAALAQSPEREDVARLLVAAYLRTGQVARAEEVRSAYKFSLGEVK